MSLTIKRAEVVDDDTVDLTFTEDDGSEVTFRFSAERPVHGIGALNGDRAFGRFYRMIPGPAFPLWPERIAMQLLAARNEPFLSGDELARRKEEYYRALEERWNARHDTEQ